MKPRSLVTGGAGFIGSHLVDCLVAAGQEVSVLDDFSTGRRANLSEAMKSGKVRVVEGSILNQGDWKTAIRGCDTVFHLAVRSVRHSLGRPLENHAVNASGTMNALEVARRHNVRKFVYCSSSEVYGNAPDLLMREDVTICRPVTVYGASKLAGEHYAAAYRETYGLATVVVRPFNAYGPRAHLHGESGEVIPRFTARILSGYPPVIFGDGKQTRDFTFVTETAKAIALAGEADAAVGAVINIAAGTPVSVLDLARSIAKACGKSDLVPEFHPPRPGDVRALWADVRHCGTLLGFQPRIPLSEGLRRYIMWLEQETSDNGASLKDVALTNWTSV